MTLNENIIVFQSILHKEIVRINRIWIQTILPPITTVTLYFVIFGNLVGAKIGLVHGVSYIEYIVPGLVMMSVIVNSYMNVCSSFFSLKFQKSVEELLVSPAENITIILGFVGGGVYRAASVGTMVLLIALFFSKLTIYSLPILLIYGFFSATLFSIAGLLNALIANKFDDVNIVPTFVLTPLTYLGGVFYSIDQLSPFWQFLSRINPIFYMVNGFRYGLIGVSDCAVGPGLVALLACNAIFLGITLSLFKSGIGLKS